MWVPEAARKYYRSMIRTQIYADRITCIYERYQSAKHSPEGFEELWGEAPRKLKIRKGPKCLDRESGVEDPQNDIQDDWMDEEVSPSLIEPIDQSMGEKRYNNNGNLFRPLRTRLVQVTLDGVIVMVSSLRYQLTILDTIKTLEWSEGSIPADFIGGLLPAWLFLISISTSQNSQTK